MGRQRSLQTCLRSPLVDLPETDENAPLKTKVHVKIGDWALLCVFARSARGAKCTAPCLVIVLEITRAKSRPRD